MPPASLSSVLAVLHELAPLSGAADWDNCGLILEPPAPRPVRRILLAIDLTSAVADEALRKKSDLIVAYHPPIFSGLKQLRASDPGTGPLLRLLEAGVAVYSPHTALDAAPGGVADWLCEALPHDGRQGLAEAGVVPSGGSGRLLRLGGSLSLSEVAAALSRHLALPYLRVAKAPRGKARIRHLGLCPGAGSSVLRGAEADAVFTGEMRHHDILDFNRRGIHVLLCEHSHSERPYLPVFAARLRAAIPKGTRIDISRADRDPLDLVLPSFPKECT